MSVPDRIGRFVVAGQAGDGGFATVFRAQDEALQSAVAIKVLSAHWAHDRAMHDRFLAEARLLRRADSDRVVRVHDIGELPDGRPYFVMTFADRGTLSERLAAGPLPWPAAVAVATEITLGLQVLHDAGILHRDIKPSNVLFRSQPGGREQLLLGDLGLGRLLTDGPVPTMVAGTPGYMAPEQGLVGAPVSVRTDVYAVGAVLFRALTGRGPAEPDVVVYPGPRSTVAPTQLMSGLPDGLDHVVLRSMARDPELRYPDVRALLADLHQVRSAPPTQVTVPAPTRLTPQPTSQLTPPHGHTGPSQPQPAPTPQPTPQHTPWPAPQPGAPAAAGRRRWWLVAGAAAAVVAVLAGAALAYAQWRTVEVASDVAGVRLAVPRGWGGQAATSGWNPSLLGLDATIQPAVLVAGSAEDFADIADTRPGAFAGLLPADHPLDADTFLATVMGLDGCTEEQAAVPVRGEVLASMRQRCNQVVLDDVLLNRSGRLAWVQVKQPAPAATPTADVVASVRLG